MTDYVLIMFECFGFFVQSVDGSIILPCVIVPLCFYALIRLAFSLMSADA